MHHSHRYIEGRAKFGIHRAVLDRTRAEAPGRILGYVHPLLVVEPMASSTQAALSPAQVRHAYGFDQLSQTGSGQMVYIVDAYSAGYDLATGREARRPTTSCRG
jgi:hypothetical protein